MSKVKLSQTKRARAMRKLRREESPRDKRIRLLKRYIGLARYNMRSRYIEPALSRERARIKAMQAELSALREDIDE